MKYLISVYLLLAVCLSSSAQKQTGSFKISGRVADSISKKSIDYATISVFQANNPKPVNGTTSNEKGTFTVENLNAGMYKIVVEFIGYRSKTFEGVLLDSKNQNRSLGDIFIAATSQTLQTVTVTGKAGLIENKIDKMIYNAEKDITSQGGVATDVLKKIPQVSVDVDGNVELQGNPNVRFLIDGKPSTVFGNNLADALQSLPASQIKSVEVITSPGAKYDAEGTGGIINIILKKTTVQGVNGSINVAGGTRLQNASLNLNARKGKFGMHGFFSGNGQLRSTTRNELDRVASDTAAGTNTRLLQNGSSSYTRNGYETGLGFDWDFTKKDNLSGSIDYEHFGNKSSGYSNQEQLISNAGSGSNLSDINSIRNSKNQFHTGTTDWSLNYKRKFKDDQDLTVEYNSSSSSNFSDFSQIQNFTGSDSIFSGLRSNNPGKEHERNFQLDYTQPLGEKSSLELGAKSGRRSFSSKSDVYSLNAATGSYVYDLHQSYALNYTRDVYAAYASIAFPLFNFIDVKSGGRFERTSTNATYSTAGKVNVPDYNTFVPSIFLSHKLDDSQVIKLSYSRRIQRPGYRVLNPYVNTVDPKNISAGNPDLKPEIADVFEGGYSTSFASGGSINVSLFYRRNDQDIQPYIVYYPEYLVGDSTYKNVAVSTPENIGVEKNVGINFYGSMPVTSKLNLRTNLSAFHRDIINRFVPGEVTTSLNYRLNLNAAYQVTDELAAEFFGNFSSAHNEAQGKMPSFTSYNFAFRKMVFKKKGSIGFTTTNPFGKYVNQLTELRGPNFTLSTLRRIPYRSFGISFMYKFGKLEFKKEVEENKDANVPTDN